MKNLILVRHAKSSWDHPVSDFERPLTSGGRKDAALVASSIANLIPYGLVIWSSNAIRASETAKIFASKSLFNLEKIIFRNQLYTFDGNELQQIIKSASDDFDHLMIFGHNEAITHFVNKFGNTFIDNVPTSGFVNIIFEQTSWKEINNGVTKTVVFPRDLR